MKAKESNSEIVERYVKTRGYEYRQSTLAIIFYGSRATNKDETSADFDLFIMTTAQIEEGKEVDIFENYTFQCEKRSYETIVNNLEKDYVMLSIIAYGEIIFSRGGNIKVLKIMAKKEIKEPIKPLDLEEKQKYATTVKNRIKELSKMHDENNPVFNHLAHITTEKIRKFYEKAIGLPHIRTNKVYRVYTDKDYYKQNFLEIKLPEQAFIDLYLEAVTDNQSIMKNIQNLWEYCNQSVLSKRC